VYINGLHRLNVETHPMSPYLDILEEGRTDVFISLHRGIYATWKNRKAAESEVNNTNNNNNNNNNNNVPTNSDVENPSQNTSEPKDAIPEEKS